MSYATEIQKADYEPIYLVQYDITRVLDFFVTYYAFVYAANFNNDYPWLLPEDLVGHDLATIAGIGSVSASGTLLKQVFSATECADNRESFYFDLSTKMLYLHCPDGKNPYLFDIKIGIIYGFRKGGDEDDGYHNDVYYDDVVKSISEISRVKSDYYNGRNVNEGGQIVVGNEHSEYDTLAEDVTIIGNSVRNYVGFKGFTFSQYQLISVGFIKRNIIGIRKLSIESQDKKERLKVSIPENTFNLTDYPNLNNNNVGKPIPLVYGIVRNLPVICVNEDEFDYDDGSRPGVPVVLTFKVADMTDYTTLHDITAVYVYDGDGHKTDVTVHAVIDLADGSFTLDSDYYVPGQKVTVDVQGYEDSDGNLIENAIDIIKELIIHYTSANYNNIYFNLSRWDRSRAFNIGIAINKSEPLEKVIEEITQKGTLANFQVDNDDRYSCRILNEAAAVNLELNEWDILNEIEIDYDQDKLVAEVEIEYSRDWEKGESIKYLDTTYKAYNVENYQTSTRQTIETLISDSTTAALFSAAFLKIYGVPYRTFSVVTNLIASRLEISDIVQIDLKRPYAPNLGLAKCEVIETRKNFDANQITTVLRIFKLILPQIWSEGNDWYSDDWYSDDWAVGMYVPDIS
jgi:hypothetical protein